MRRRRSRATLLRRVAVGAFGALLVLQSVASGAAQSAIVTGRVVEGARDRPVPNVSVYLSGSGQRRAVLTDDSGRFAFEEVTPGPYSLTAVRFGMVRGEYGKHWPTLDGRPFDVHPGANVYDLVMRVWRMAAIRGTVRDERGDPLVGVTVRALRVSTASGHGLLSFDVPGVCGGAGCLVQTTDDRGRYGFSLPPGEYVIAVPVVAESLPAIEPQSATGDVRSATPGAYWVGGGGISRRRGSISIPSSDFVLADERRVPPAAFVTDDGLHLYQSQFFPMASTIDGAARLVVTAGSVRGNVDFSLVPRRTVSIEGLVVHDGVPVPGLLVRLVPTTQESLLMDLEVAVTITDRSGRFVFHGVTPGAYRARAFANGDVALWADEAVTIGAESANGLLVRLATMARISGRVEFAATRPPPPDTGAFVAFERADGHLDMGVISLLGRSETDTSGRFTSSGLPPGRYFVRLSSAPDGWRLDSIRLAGRDVRYQPIELGRQDLIDVTVVLTAQAASSIRGTVRGTGASAAVVIAFPTDEATWTGSGTHDPRFIQVAADRLGQYFMPDVPEGEYGLVAFVESEEVLWREASYLESLAERATPVTVQHGQAQTVDLNVGGGS